jgi:dynactin-4
VISTPGGREGRPKRPPFAISLPTSTFNIAPFAEAWEYDEEELDPEDEPDDDYIEDMLAGRAGTDRASPSRTGDSVTGRGAAVGVLERKANITKIGGEVIVGRDGSGRAKVCFLIYAI